MDGELEDACLQVVAEAYAAVVVGDDGVLIGRIEDLLGTRPVGVHRGERVVAQLAAGDAPSLGDALIVAWLSERTAVVVGGGRDVHRRRALRAELLDARYGAAGVADEVAYCPDTEPGSVPLLRSHLRRGLQEADDSLPVGGTAHDWPRSSFAASTMLRSEGFTSSQRRVLRPQSGFTQSRSAGMTATALRRRSLISSVSATRGEWMS